ncbi:divalent-cation tolerance protein CutA [Pelomonas sp. APW6]|uniref:Divalent-cation tolerance protein CutA n=1 Tax=Roseateles subflavus TaxID=3053353 RepID=A0ABT7LE49_9BURK|nr:divalent-cation tolerance protein CutA [Pelomonas sp. APW6]MDL5031144.1 divalent-cation tolerance protein CutA [Pelomonas sp. APW6]
MTTPPAPAAAAAADEAPPLLLMLTTLPSREAAQALAREAVQRRLAACAQIEAIESLYRWEDTLCEDPEWRLLLKTTPACRTALAALVSDLHPYELPAVLCVPVSWAEPAFAAWVDDSCRAPAGGPPGDPAR